MEIRRKKGSEIELKIDDLVFGGRGIGQLDGWKVFVADTVPGDLVRAQLTKIKKGYGEARLIQVLEPSKLRIAARCKHFETCGGCKWQFLPYEDQLKFKESQVRDIVERLGGVSGDKVLPILGCSEPWFYRNKMEMSFGEGNDGVMLGFYPPGYHYEVFDLKECHLMAPWMAEIAARVREFAHKHNLSEYNSRTNEGLLRNLILREGKNTGEVMVNLVTSSELFDYADDFAALFADDERVTSVYWTTVHQVKGQKTWLEEKLLAGKEVLTEALELEDGSRLEFDIRPQAFFQTNTLQAQVLYSQVLAAAGLTGAETVFDLYCGTGTIGLFCAHKAKHVYGIEVNESAVENARSNAARNKIENASFFLGTVESQLENLESKPDVVIVDPPRSGLGEKVVAKTAAFGADRIVYVSCNPTTMARDLVWFAELGYEAQQIRPVDMFPHTHHVECVAVLTNLSF
jgi:23S rRNA (uracil1939-C5)-methyltransferase